MTPACFETVTTRVRGSHTNPDDARTHAERVGGTVQKVDGVARWRVITTSKEPAPMSTTTNLTPYDTGERATPKPWVGEHHGGSDPEPYGRVDFDDDEGTTVATIHLARMGGRYVVRIDTGAEDLAVEVDGTPWEVAR